MTISEIKALAEGGDVQAMMALGEHYYDKYQEDDFPLAAEKSLPWYEMAGMHGDVEGASRCMILGSAQVLMAKEAGDFDQMREHAAYFSKVSTQYMDIDDLVASSAYEEIGKCMDVCLYAFAVSCYLNEKFAVAANGLDAIKEDSEYYGMAQVLKGICLSDMDKDLEGAECLTILGNDMNSLLPSAHDSVDEEILERGTLYFALYLRMLERKTDAAYELINRALDVIDDEQVRAILLDELTHYKKKLFGGYKYVD